MHMPYRLAGLACTLLALAAAPFPHALAGGRTPLKATPATAKNAIVIGAMDQSVDACDDLYLRACGAYIASAKPDAAHPRLSMAERQFDANLQRSFQTLFAQNTKADPELARLATFYHSCMSGHAGDAAVVKAWLGRIDAAQTPAQIQALLLQLSAIGVDPFFTYIGQPDRKQWDRYRGEIHASYLWAEQPAVVQAFVSTGMDQAAAQRDAATVVAMVTALRKQRGNRWDGSTAENPRTLAELAELAPSIDWAGFAALVGAGLDRPINVTSPAYLRAVQAELASRSPAELRAFLRWSFLFSLRGELPAQYNAAFGDIIPPLRVQTGDPEGRCRDATVRAMGVEFSRQFATRVLGVDAREAAARIASEIKGRIVSAIAGAEWLSPAARAATADKLAKTDLKIGFPDKWPAVGHYPLSGSAFLANVLAARSFEQRRAWSRAGQEHLNTNWDMIVSPWVGDGMAAARLVVPNGYPDALSNSIIMTAAFLGAPRFDADAPPELNYATFGAVFAHEFVHVAQNHMFGPDGREQELWSEADIKAEDKQAQCLIEQANAYQPLPGVKMDGERQYGENVADLSGLRLAFEALEARLGAERLYREDDSGSSPAQRFFIRYAQNRCTAQTEDYLRKSVSSDGHAPEAFRVNAAAWNLPAFSRAFHCKANARMTRPAAQQCQAW